MGSHREDFRSLGEVEEGLGDPPGPRGGGTCCELPPAACTAGEVRAHGALHPRVLRPAGGAGDDGCGGADVDGALEIVRGSAAVRQDINGRLLGGEPKGGGGAATADLSPLFDFRPGVLEEAVSVIPHSLRAAARVGARARNPGLFTCSAMERAREMCISRGVARATVDSLSERISSRMAEHTACGDTSGRVTQFALEASVGRV